MEEFAPAQEDPHVDAITPRLEEHEITRVQVVAPDAFPLWSCSLAVRGRSMLKMP